LDEDNNSLRISKEILPSLEGFDFTETILGDPMGCLRQYRNSTGVHVREYEGYFEVHRDRIDPRGNPIGHLICDSPETVAAFAVASTLSPAASLVNATGRLSSTGSPLDFFRIFLFFNRFFRALKRLLF